MGRNLIPAAAEALQRVLQSREDADNRGDQGAVSDLDEEAFQITHDSRNEAPF